MSERLVTTSELAAFADEGTTAHRLWTGLNGWVDRFGDDYLVSAASEGGEIAARLPGWLADLGLKPRRLLARRLVKQPGEEDKPVQISGDEGPLETVVSERGLRFAIDFAAGYSTGLFCDQRANRAYLESLQPRRVLNCFAYTCAFSVAAARAGAATLSLDLSRKSLERGRSNLALNAFAEEGHRFIADDVFAVLPRLARRGQKFDAIILDPPTFSRGAKGQIFRVEENLGSLLEEALEVAESGARILLSTNARDIDVTALKVIARGLESHVVPPPPEYPPFAAAATLWLVAD